ncbi:hypothetical protein [Brevundimonas viscosa]|uniref:Uncharacterized protein n=1 Tax=Brevundimonas viscosa TaxID=871741 RepID=A0A1I6NRC7_9CAUL|nr:hypothetical protein [Brevundimonas viscosa]SFS30411.1 hypothetical protein SAMN05192570_0383 [Brevundimonas viscosa]
MSRYSLRLHRVGRPPVEEPLDAVDVEEARELARMRLLLTQEFSYVDLRRRGRHVEGFDRDGDG